MKSRTIWILVLVVLFAILLIQNSSKMTPLKFYFWSIYAPLFILVFFIFLIGFLVGFLAAKSGQKKDKVERGARSLRRLRSAAVEAAVMKAVFNHLKTFILRGLLAVIPLALSYIVLRFLYLAVDQRVAQIIEKWIGRNIPGLGLVLVLAILYLLGLAASNLGGPADSSA